MLNWLRDIILDIFKNVSVALGGYLYGVNRTKHNLTKANLKATQKTLDTKRKIAKQVEGMTDEELNEFIG